MCVYVSVGEKGGEGGARKAEAEQVSIQGNNFS